MSCLTLIVRLIIVKEGTNTPNFSIFEYDAEYGSECGAVSGAK